MGWEEGRMGEKKSKGGREVMKGARKEEINTVL